MKGNQLAWWEDATLALALWLAVMLESFRPPIGRPGPPGRPSQDQRA